MSTGTGDNSYKDKICPILSLGVLMKGGAPMSPYGMCMGPKCALYVDPACALALLPGAIIAAANAAFEDEDEEPTN